MHTGTRHYVCLKQLKLPCKTCIIIINIDQASTSAGLSKEFDANEIIYIVDIVVVIIINFIFIIVVITTTTAIVIVVIIILSFNTSISKTCILSFTMLIIFILPDILVCELQLTESDTATAELLNMPDSHS